MRGGKANPNAVAVAPARDLAILDELLQGDPNPEQFGVGLARIFQVRRDEVALLGLRNSLLKFLYPEELKTAGSIPLSSSSAVAAHTAAAKKVEVFNNFASVKHVGIFETIKLSRQGESEESQPGAIQKLMSAPVLDSGRRVLGVVQVCRKGYDAKLAGPDFTPP